MSGYFFIYFNSGFSFYILDIFQLSFVFFFSSFIFFFLLFLVFLEWLYFLIIVCYLGKTYYDVHDGFEDEDNFEAKGDYGDWGPLHEVWGGHHINVDAQQVLDKLENGPKIDGHLGPHFPFLIAGCLNSQEPHIDLQKSYQKQDNHTDS